MCRNAESATSSDGDDRSWGARTGREVAATARSAAKSRLARNAPSPATNRRNIAAANRVRRGSTPSCHASIGQCGRPQNSTAVPLGTNAGSLNRPTGPRRGLAVRARRRPHTLLRSRAARSRSAFEPATAREIIDGFVNARISASSQSARSSHAQLQPSHLAIRSANHRCDPPNQNPAKRAS
jgi:hypothetical protein